MAQISSAAAEIIGSNHDLVMEILLLLPPKSLLRFKSVSKTWFSLISDRTFSILWQKRKQSHDHPKISGLFFTCESRTQIKYIPLKETDDVGKSKSLARFPHINTTIKHSCNGLLLCCLKKPGYCPRSYQVYNPTTKQFRSLPCPFSSTTYPHDPLYLAFDPSKSLHYKVVAFQRIVPHKYNMDNYLYQIHIYSSETKDWRPFGGDTIPGRPVSLSFFDYGVYFNGSIHWISFHPEQASIYFDVDRERLCPMPSLPILSNFNALYRHFGESGGHLHFIQSSSYTTYSIDISQMESDYSKWSLKYRVDLNMMLDFVIQDMIMSHILTVLGLVDGEDGDVYLMLFAGTNMIISYNLKDNTFKKLHDVAHHPGSSTPQLVLYKHCSLSPFIETWILF